MSDKKNERYYESLSLRMPPDIDMRFYDKGERTMKRINRYPDKIPLSWGTEYGYVWDYISHELDYNFLPPPLIIDNRRKPPRSIVNDNGSTTTNYIIGAFHTACRVYMNEDGTRLTGVIPTDYEMRIFQKNFELDINGIWGPKLHVPIEILRSHMWHTLVHECYHYLTVMDKYQEMLQGLSKPEDVSNAIANLGGVMDETETEIKTILTMIYYHLNSIYGKNPGIKTINGQEVNLGVVINGNFDLWMRRKDENYAAISLYLNLICYNLCENFGLTEEDARKFMNYRVPTQKTHVDMLKEMFIVHENIWRKEGKYKYLFVE